jgi:hypothetical protein
MEKDNDIANEEDDYATEFCDYDARLGRRWNLGPVKDPNL